MEHEHANGCEVVTGWEPRGDGCVEVYCDAPAVFDGMCRAHATENAEEGDVFTVTEAAAFEALTAARPRM